MNICPSKHTIRKIKQVIEWQKAFAPVGTADTGLGTRAQEERNNGKIYHRSALSHPPSQGQGCLLEHLLCIWFPLLGFRLSCIQVGRHWRKKGKLTTSTVVHTLNYGLLSQSTCYFSESSNLVQVLEPHSVRESGGWSVFMHLIQNQNS